MIKKLSLFLLQSKTIANKLKKAGINNSVLENEPTIYFNINKIDSTDYHITLNETTNKTGFYSDFIDSAMFNDFMEIDDIVYYIQNELKERYYLSNKKYEQFQEQIVKNRRLTRIELLNDYLTTRSQITENNNKILTIKIDQLEIQKKSYNELENLEYEKVKIQYKKSKNKNAMIIKENKIMKLELDRLQSILLNIQSIAV
ncbi:hypothetical protein [Clostridium sp.]|uniref:hypothetical protein n=1 Tax=Clostridium sp. TaxID=1506 RepID=UPI001A5C8CC9|nr:hypothetical protein [Clostridium sp.]MBK5239783.1 hypothetical protein [Clostridium sp.]